MSLNHVIIIYFSCIAPLKLRFSVIFNHMNLERTLGSLTFSKLKLAPSVLLSSLSRETFVCQAHASSCFKSRCTAFYLASVYTALYSCAAQRALPQSAFEQKLNPLPGKPEKPSRLRDTYGYILGTQFRSNNPRPAFYVFV